VSPTCVALATDRTTCRDERRLNGSLAPKGLGRPYHGGGWGMIRDISHDGAGHHPPTNKMQLVS
jgi:hypothetical protein